MANKKVMDEAKYVTIGVDQYMYDVAMEWVSDGFHTSFSEVVRTALDHYANEMEEYTDLMRKENKARDENSETGIGRDINGNMIYIPTYRFREWELDGDLDKAIDRHINLHNAMLDPDFYKTIDE